jgi:Arc/MetJ family transcription regulator
MTAKAGLDRRLARIEALLIAANGRSPGLAIRKQLVNLAVSAACVPAGQDRLDDPQDREDEADQAQHPMALAEAENGEDQQQDKIDDA